MKKSLIQFLSKYSTSFFGAIFVIILSKDKDINILWAIFSLFFVLSNIFIIKNLHNKKQLIEVCSFF